jgi:hypothetical protein
VTPGRRLDFVAHALDQGVLSELVLIAALALGDGSKQVASQSFELPFFD